MSKKRFKQQPYSNFKLNDDEGNFLCYIDDKRAKWYIRKQLVTVVDEKTLNLKFKPKGPGKSLDGEFYKSPIKNICVVCGSTDQLTRHHIVPHRYRKFFPEKYKSYANYDIVVLCFKHHVEYETHSYAMHVKLAKDAGLTIKPAKPYNIQAKVDKTIRMLINHGILMPLDKRDRLLHTVREYFSDPSISLDNISNYKVEFKEVESITPSEVIMNKCTDLKAFMLMWRKHFIDTAQPKFLPTGWMELIDTIIETDKKPRRSLAS